MRGIIIGVFLIISCTVVQHETAKILGIFPMPSKSHTILASALFKQLASKGHQVTMITSFPMDNPPTNYSQVHLDWHNNDDGKTWFDPNISGFRKLQLLIEHVGNFLNDLHGNQNLRSFLAKNDKYDACIYLNGLSEAFLGVCHHLNATPIAFNTVGMNIFVPQLTRNPTPYSYVPNIYMPFSDKMSFMQRVANTIAWNVFEFLLTYVNMPVQRYIYAKYYPNGPPLDELIAYVDLVLANSNYATDNIVPLLPNVIPIGGFHLEEKETLPDHLKQYLDSSKNGVIYFNLGTNAKGKFIEKKTLDLILASFTKSKYDVLMKFEDELEDLPKNVRIEKWLPQRAILTHPNVKLFVTHGGFGGTVEAIYGGVPMLCMPFVGDQSKNCAGSVANGYAKMLDITKMTEETFSRSLAELIDDSSYKEKIMLKSDLYRNQVTSPMNRAVFWVEHVIKHNGAKHLKSRANDLPWYQYMLLDVILFLSIVLLSVVGLIWFICKIVLKFSCKVIRRVYGSAHVQISSEKKMN